MTHDSQAPEDLRTGAGGACERCLRRSWLLALLSARLEYRGREGRLLELLQLSDEQLVQAVGGRRRVELRERLSHFDPDAMSTAPGVAAVCRHDRRYPRALLDTPGPPMLHVAGSLEALCAPTERPVVAIVGSERASDYGREMAASLARGLSASEITVAGTLCDGIAAAAHAGALEAGAPGIAVLGGGVDVAFAARRRRLYEAVRAGGCLVGELPCGMRARRWALRAAERIVAALARLTVVVEAEDRARDLGCARIASALGRSVAAIPGRVTSPLSSGAHTLLREGACLVRGPADVLELLCGQETRAVHTRGDRLAARLRHTLERVGAGLDTPERLAAAGEDLGATLLALAELELLGLLARGDGGRYVPRETLDASQRCGGAIR
ncbi:MAG TPA: DNA-processing protein DprA [Solirubrobacteraceae bacterium]|nr:DNA-processing protein DprA [Solirubrobacteraceae bacterium]